MPEAIVFDFDGVIADSEPLHYRAFLETGRALGVSFDYPRYLAEYVGYDDRDAVRAMLAEAGRDESEETVARLVREKGERFEGLAEQGVEPLPGARELVRAAAERFPVAVASGAMRREIELILRSLGLRDAFEAIVAADDVARSKPAPETYARAVEALQRGRAGLTPAACLAIEDTDTGIASAVGAGLRVLAVGGTCAPSELAGAERFVESLEGLDAAWLERMFP